jgi:hypothetical protein
MTETLTEYDRYDLEMIASGLPGHVVSKALRIIDAHQADREALVEQAVQLKREREEARDRAEAAEQKLTQAQNAHGRGDRARLAAADALLGRVVCNSPEFRRAIDAHLAGQPAAPTRTEAERIIETELVTLHDARDGTPFVLSVREMRAELARRGLK